MKKITIALLALISLFTISCEIGLGAAVDTEPPALDIVTPPVDAIIRDNFAIRGIWSDDGAIDTISIKLDRTDGKGSSLEFAGEFVESKDKRGSGTWTAEIPAKSKPVTDGTYQAVVTIKDATGRTTTQSTTFTIDNTPPLLILQRPATDISTTDESSIDTYGKILTLEGRAADDNNIDHIDVKIYSDPGKTNLIHTITLKNVPLSIALDAAKWGDEAYNAIYGNTVEDKKRFYCSIEAYDAAQRYPADGSDQQAADKNGNCANYYYLYNEIASSSIADYKVTELYSVLNGTSSRAATDTKTVKDLLTKLKKGTGQFFLNPKNNPTFKLASWKARETPADEESGFVTFHGAGISIDVEPGLDSYPIDKDSLKVYFIEAEYNSSTTPVIKSGAPKMYLSPDDMDIKGASSYKIAITIDTGKSLCNEAGETVESYKLKTSKDYLVVVEGYDKIGSTRGNPLIPESLSSDLTGYPIHIANAGGAPEVNVTYYKLNSEANTDSIIYMPKYAVDTETPSVLTLSGTIDFKAPYENASSLDGIEFKVLIDNDEQHPIYTKANLNYEVGSSIYTFTDLAITGTNLGTSDQHELTIYANNGSSAWVRKTVVYDTDGPVVEVSSLTPVAKKYDEDESTDGNYYLNGKVSFKVSFNDAKDIVDTSKRKPKVEFVHVDNVVNIKSGITSLSETIKNVDTTNSSLIDDTDNTVIIRVTAYDRAGNKSVYNVVAKDDDGTPQVYKVSETVPENTRPYRIDQDTDKPYIVIPENATTKSLTYTYPQITDSTNTNRKNIYNENDKLRLKFIDDDGVKRYTFAIRKIADGDDVSNLARTGVQSAELTPVQEFNFSTPLTTAGFYAVWIDVEDIYGNIREMADPFFIQVAPAAPVLTLDNDKYITTSTSVTESAIKAPLKVKISIDSTEEPFEIRRKEITTSNTDPDFDNADPIVEKTSESPRTTAAGTTTAYDYYTIDSTKADGEYKIKYFVKDKNGSVGVKTATYKLDKTAPTITTQKFVLNQTQEDIADNKWYQTDTLSLLVTANDGTNDYKSGLLSIEYSLNGGEGTPLTPQQSSQSTTDETYKRNVTFAEGTNSLIIRAIDNVGNKSEITKTVKIDISAPEFSVANSQNMIYINKSTSNNSLVLTGEYKDNQSGVDELVLSLGTQNAEIKYYAEAVNAANPKSLEDVAESDWKTYGTITDKASIKYWKAEFSTAKLNTVFNKDANGNLLTKSKKLTISGKNLCSPAKAIPNASIPDITIMMDIDEPEFESISIKSANGKGVYQKSDNEYFISTTLGDTFTISGIAKDDTSSVKSVTCSIDGTELDPVESAGWSFPITFASTDTEKTIKLSITDKAGNKYNNGTEITISVKVDDLAPKGIHALDDKHKDLYFRIGDNNNDDISVLTEDDKNVGGKYSENTYGNANTIKVRGRFDDSGSGVKMIYYKVINAGSTTMSYSELKTKAEDFLANSNYTTNGGENGYTGYFAPLTSDEEETKRVFFNSTTGKIPEKTIASSGKIAINTIDDDNDSTDDTVYVVNSDKKIDNKYYENITTNYSSILSGFTEGTNYLILVAEDNAGNAALDTIIVGNVGDYASEEGRIYYNASLNVDTELPTAEADSTEIKYTNAEEGSTIIFSGTARDDDAGVYGLVIKSNGKEIKVGDTTNGILTLYGDKGDHNRTWSVEIKADEVFGSADDGSKSVSAFVIDCAGSGNTQTVPVGTVIVDTTGPTVKLTAPDDADADTEGVQVNGTISLSGTISDANVLPAVAITGLRYNTTSKTLANDDPGWHNFADLPGVTLSFSGNYTFTIGGVDTTKLDDGTYYIQAVATDQAGNIGYSSGDEIREIKIAQDSDRPKVNITNLTYDSTLSKYLLKYGTNSQVTGRISDDDAKSDKAVDTFIISDTPYTGTGTVTNRVKSYTASTGDFTYEPGNTEDGQKTFYIYIKDNGGKEFYTTASTTSESNLKNPKILLNGAAQPETVNESEFKYLSDSRSPASGVGKGLPYYTESSTKKLAKDSSKNEYAIDNDNSNLNSSFILGGTGRQFVKFYFTATDYSGIGGMTLKISDTKASPTVKLQYTTATSITGAEEGELEGYTLDVGEGKGEFNDTDDNSQADWTTDYIDISTWESGQYSVEVKFFDKVGLSAKATYSFYVDNEGPTIEVTSPENGEEKTATIKIAGTTAENGNAGLNNIYWLIPTRAQVSTAEGKTSDAERFSYLKGLSWNGGKDSLASGKTVSSWEFHFDGVYDEETSQPASYIFKKGNPAFGIYDKYDTTKPAESFASAYSDGVYTLPVYFMATDSLGNYTIKEDWIIRHNPDGDKPKVTITYPTTENYDKDSNGNPLGYTTLGGTISVTGSAEIPSNTTTVKNVYLQIATSAGKFDSEDRSKAGTGTGNYGFTVVDAYTVINIIKGTSYATATMTDDVAKTLGFESKSAMDSWWGIAASGGTSWRLPLNSDGKMNPSTGTNDIKIRACAVNANGKMGAWTQGENVISIKIDKNVPEISEIVAQYSDTNGTPVKISAAPTTAPTAKQHYESDMFLRGYWALVLEVLDETGIETVNVKTGDEAVTHYKSALSKNSKTGYTVYIPINDEVTSVTYDVEVTDKVNSQNSIPHTTKASYSFKLDSRAPSLDAIKDGVGNTLSVDDENTVENNDYVFGISGSSDDFDGGSGVKHVVFYYMRKSGTTKTTIGNQVILDPMIVPVTQTTAGVTTTTYGKEALSGMTELTFDDTPEKLYAKAVAGAVKDGGEGAFNKFTATTASEIDSHIRIGGLVKIDGTFRVISDVNGGDVTFTPAATAASTGSTAYFPIAQVIDNTNTASDKTTNPFTFGEGKDDGDKMIESFTRNGTVWTWDASINSMNLPDGPATLVVLAFDNAGNVNGKHFNVMVANNSPRIAKVFLATDLNKDGSFSENEFEAYNIGAKTGNSSTGTAAYELTTAGFGTWKKDVAGKWNEESSTRKAFTIKNGLAVLPEIVGGNGTVKLVFNNNDAATTMTGTPGSGTALRSSEASTLNISATLTGGDALSGKPYWKISSTDVGDSSAEGSNKQMSFTFWDETEECTQGNNSQYAFLRVKDFTVDQIDSIAPNVVVNPFFWTSASANSLYNNSAANGHIDLEADLEGTAAGTLYGADPKVSGKIVLRGTAYDDTLLKTLSFTMTNFKKAANATSDTVFAMATYQTGTNAGWSVESKTMSSDGYEVSIEPVYMNQDGHKVNWTVAIDTALLSDVAHLNAVFNVVATDQKAGTANSSADSTGTAAGTTDATKHKPSYTMDVVPYITGVKRNVKYNTNRARSGATPLLRSEEGNIIEGFNLGWYADDATEAEKNKYAVSIIPNKNGTGTALAMEEIALSNSTLTFKLPSTAKDGYLTVKINDVQSLNNYNNDSAAYNKENTANVSSTDYWTDTRYVRVWQSNTSDYFAGSTLPIYPSMAMGTNGTLYASWSNYSKSDVYYAAVNSQTATQVYHGYDPPEETAISVAGADKVNVFYSANYHGGNSFNWTSNSTSAGGLYAYDSNAPAINCSRQDNNAFRFELFYHNQQLQQFKNLNIKRVDNATDGLIHVAYYDTVTNSIHYSEIAGNYNPSGTIYLWENNRVYNGGDPADYHEISWINIDGKADEQDENYPDRLTPSTTNHNYYGTNYNCENYETYTTADGSERYYRYFDNYNYKLSTSQFEDTARTEATGESLSLALTTSNYPVIAYYDADNGVLKVARALSTTPKGGAATWKVQDVLSSTDKNYKTMVDYISCDIDSNGILHIVFQNTKGELCYIKSNNASADGAAKYTFGQSVVVADSATNIDLTLHGTTPYISYLTRVNSFDGMNIAFWDSTLDLNCDGTAEGGWETMTAALSQKVSNVKSCIEAHPNPTTNGVDWEAAVGFTPGDLYRVAYYVGNGKGH
ncbi:hypothetical protein SAMN04487775_11037 [Treponema bryantii]|uniref:Ig-like domain (Group 3) n=1 Tax=Treponema bryantii TaxID=163 RepID=A0A1I3MPY3_9SPIR|nr:Ig-like domain-containing protein [Treponema bryantii]SFI99047.1 hypothetical protein SAMN04487775_11037 [Treponema bryantii]